MAAQAGVKDTRRMNTDWHECRRALAEAQERVLKRLHLGNPAETLRSAELGLYLTDYPESWFCSPQNIAEIQNLIAARRQLVQGQTFPASGRILCAFYGWDTQMGEGNPASAGVIDDAYLPPWDTWFAVFPLAYDNGEGRVLLAWIPADLTEAVQEAIEIAATQPIHWMDEAFLVVSGTDAVFIQQLESELQLDRELKN